MRHWLKEQLGIEQKEAVAEKFAEPVKQAEKIAPAVKETPGQKLRRELEQIRQRQQQQRRSGGMHISRLPQFKDDSCYVASGKYCACIQFHFAENKRRGFHTSQLIEYSLEPNPDAEDDKDLPPQKLALAKRYAEVDRHMPFVASISIKPIAKG